MSPAMGSGSFLPVAVLAVAAALLLITVSLGLRKAIRHRQARRDARQLEAVRPMLFDLLETEDSDELPELSDPRGARALDRLAHEMLGKLRGGDRAALVRWLAHRGTLDRAHRALRSRSAVRRARAAELLGRAGDATATSQLATLLGDRNPDVRAVAARALGKLGDPAAVPALLSAIDSRRPIPATVVTMAVMHVGPAAVEPLGDALGSAGSHGRAIAAELLGLHGAFSAAETLTDGLEDSSPRVRAAAAHALGRLGLQSTAGALVQRVRDDESVDVRVSAAWALGEIGGDRAVDGLRIGLLSGDPVLARTAATGLDGCSEAGHQVLRAAVLQPGSWVPYAREALELGPGASRSRPARWAA